MKSYLGIACTWRTCVNKACALGALILIYGLVSCSSSEVAEAPYLDQSVFNSRAVCPKDFECEELDLSGARVIKFSRDSESGQFVMTNDQLQTVTIFRPKKNGKVWERQIKARIGGNWTYNEKKVISGDATFLKREAWSSARRAQAIIDQNGNIEAFHIYREKE